MPPPGQPNGGGQPAGPGDPSTPNSPDEDSAAHGGVMTGLFGPVEGVPRLDHYDLGYDSGAWNNIPRKFWGLLTQLAWTFVLWLVQIALWMLSWGLTFGFASFLTDPANSVAHSWQDIVGSQLGLTVFVLTITAAWAGIRLMRGQSQRGLAEFATSLLVLGVTASVLATPGTTLLGPDGLMGQAKNVSLAFAGAAFDPAHGADTGMDSKDLIANMSKGVVSAFVVRPHQILDWGSTLDRPGKEKCLAAYTKLIEKGPWGSQDNPRDRMNDAGCTSEADFNHDPGPDRMVGAVLVAIAALFVMVLMILIAVGLAAAQVGLAFLAIVAPLALLAGLLPGSARQPLWAWFVGVLKALTAVMASIMFLGVFLLLVNASLASSEGKPLLARLAVLDILVLFGIGLRKRLVAAAQSVASGITSKVASSSAGGPPIGGFWGTGAAIGGAGNSAGAAGVEGGDVARLWRDTRGEIGRLPRMYRDIRLGLAARRPRAGTGLRPARDLDTGPRRRRDPSDLAEDVGADGRRDRLVAELGRSKTGRGVLGATRAGAAGTKFGWAATLGLPVSVPRASTAGREAARRSGQSVRDELVRQKAAGAAYWKEWGDGVAGGARLAYQGTGARAAVTRMRRSPTP